MKRGIYPVVHTPLNENESIDFNGLEASLAYYNHTNIPGITLLGSGGELPYFSDNEQLKLVASASKYLDADKAIISGVFAHSFSQAIEKIDSYTPYVDYVLLLLTDYYRIEFSDHLNALKSIAEQAKKSIIYYYFPQMTGRYYRPEQLVEILKIDNIIGIKDSSVHLPTAKEILAKSPETMYFSGLCLTLESTLNEGAAGAICPVAAVLPQRCQDFFDAITGRHVELKSIRAELIDILPIVNTLKLSANIQYRALKILSAFPFPLIRNVASSHAKVKYALQVLGVATSYQSRSPLPMLSEHEQKKIKVILQDII